MGNWKHVIADSGGSTTTWAFCHVDGTVTYRHTAGLHPKTFLNWQQPELEKLRSELDNLPAGKLWFYGAGCSQEMVQESMKLLLLALGFESVEVFPDTLAACRATCGQDPGLVAILGTGSVLIEYDGKKIVNRIGGWGSIIGDEGSGFHFARLVLRDYLGGVPGLPEEVGNVLGTPTFVLQQLASPAAQQWIAGLAGRLAEIPLPKLHKANLNAFLAISIPQVKSEFRTMNVIGSYGFHQQVLLEELLSEEGYRQGVVTRDPIKQLVGFHSQSNPFSE